MRTSRVTVRPYDIKWKSNFEDIARELRLALGSLALAVEHVGSTAVEGMSAKPCIDVDVVISDSSVLGEVISKLAVIGYIHEGDLGIVGREAFRYESKPHLAAHHLYVCEQSSPELYRHVTFRDFLRANPAAAHEYSTVKEEGAKLYPSDIDKYIAHKSEVIKKLYVLCGLE